MRFARRSIWRRPTRSPAFATNRVRKARRHRPRSSGRSRRCPDGSACSWDDAAEKDRGLLIAQVVPGSPAAKAGLRAGDRIIKFAGHELDTGKEFRSLVLGAASPAAVVVERAGSEKPLELRAELIGEPILVGISWSSDDAEPRSVIVLRVVPDSPADRAGIKVDDRIEQVNGKDFSSSDEFDHLLATEPSPLEMAVESHGQIRHVRVEMTSE